MLDVVFTGPAPRKISRNLMAMAARMVGCHVRSSFCSKTNLVVAPTRQFNSRKASLAAQQGVEIMTYAQFIRQYNLAAYVY